MNWLILMTKQAKRIAKGLLEAFGDEFEEAVYLAFNYLGLNSKSIGKQEGDADIIAASKWLGKSYKIVVECCAAYNTNQVSNDKVSQIRGSAPKHYTGEETLYHVVVGRPKFSNSAIRNAKPEVCLILAEDLAKLVCGHAKYNLGNKELEEVFVSVGTESRTVQELLETNETRLQRILSVYALICIAAQKLALEDKTGTMSVHLETLVGTARAYGETLRFGRYRIEEIREGLAFLSSPIVGLITIKKEAVAVKGIDIKEALNRIGPFGVALMERYLEVRNKLTEALSGTE